MKINGSRGRHEIGADHSGNGLMNDFNYIDYYDRRGGKITYELSKTRGDHGGGDVRLLRILFVGDLPDPLGLMAGSRVGAISILTGAAADKSI